MITLREALAEVEAERWAGTRSHRTIMSQATAAVESLERFGVYTVGEIPKAVTDRLAKEWIAEGLSPATINHRIGNLKLLGCTGIKRTRKDRTRKWWLSEDQLRAIRATTSHRKSKDEHWARFLDFLEWTTLSGLRIEESLRLERGDVMRSPSGLDLRVRGTKSDRAARPIALSKEAQAVLERYLRYQAHPRSLVWGFAYRQVQERWVRARADMKWEDEAGCTLKALRRSAARHLSVKGMPTGVLKDYLGHERISTTEGYLHLTGGFSTEEQRRWL